MRRKATSIRDLGTRFEVLTKQFLLTDKLYRARFSKVWMWGEWEGNDGPDTGIDLIAEERVGGDGKGANSELCAIQCKCYDDSDGSLDMKSVSTFLAKTAALNIRNKILVYTGSSMTSHARKLLEDHRCSIITSSVFRDSTIDWGGFPRLKQKEPKRLYEYQEAARRDVIAGFLNNDRGKLIMAGGTGKTLVSLRIAE